MNSTDCKLNPEADWATIRQLRADLATVTAERDLLETQKAAIARRVLELEDIKPLLDGAELAETRKALEQAPYQAFLNEQRAHVETRKALGALRAKYDADLSDAELAHQLDIATITEQRTERHQAELHWMSLHAQESAAHANTRKALEETEARWQNAWATVDSTRAELAKAEARVKAALNYYDGQGSVCDHMREMVRLLRG